jgi:uncharacterized membrane protein YdjX (TVP38/TMEM64 family)
VVRQIGLRGPIIIILFALASAFLFLPRWPICFACGMFYGILWGTVLSTFASLLAAWLHFWLARSLLARTTSRLIAKSRYAGMAIRPEKAFVAVVLLRAFPLSNFVVTNLLAGALRLNPTSYLMASFFGMVPSSLMYAAWGKFARKPSPLFLVTAVVIMLACSAAYLAARKRLPAWMARVTGGQPGGGS